MRQQLDSLALALPMPLILGCYTRVFLARFLLDVYSALASQTSPAHYSPWVNGLQQYWWTPLPLPKAHWFKHDLGIVNVYI